MLSGCRQRANIIDKGSAVVIVAPFIRQTRFIGLPGIACTLCGMISGILGIVLYLVSLRYLWPAFRNQYNEFNPTDLIVKGPYNYVRHPIYLSLILILIGLSAIMRAALSLTLVPLLYVELKLITLYEEKRILKKKFSSEYSSYRKVVPKAMLGLWPCIAASILYLFVAAAVFSSISGFIFFEFLR